MRKSVGILFLLVIVLFSCNNEKKERKNEAVSVKVETIDVKNSISNNSFVGTIEASASSTLSSKFSGKIINLNVKQGDKIKQGDVIAVIESQNVKSTLESAEATLSQAEDGYQRLKKVHDTRSVADVKMIEIETQLAKAKAAAVAARSAADDCFIKAPFDGVVGEIFVSDNEDIISLQPICTVFDISSLQLSISVPEKEIGKINIGDSALFSVGVLDNVTLHAVVDSKGLNASKISRNYDCKLSVVEKNNQLLPGMIANLFFSDNINDCLSISPKYIKMDEVGKYVWCVNNDNIVEKKYIELGDYVASGVIVKNGLSIGDKIIVDGFSRICCGTKVIIIP